MIEITSADRKLAAELDNVPRKFAALCSPEGRTAIDATWRINCVSDDSICRRGGESLRKFLRKYCSVDVPLVVERSAQPFELRLASKAASGEGCDIVVGPDVVEVCGDSPAGALYGAHKLQWMMGANGGPYLEPGSFRVEPKSQVRIASTPFHQPFDDGGDPLTYSDEPLTAEIYSAIINGIIARAPRVRGVIAIDGRCDPEECAVS